MNFRRKHIENIKEDKMMGNYWKFNGKFSDSAKGVLEQNSTEKGKYFTRRK